ncbi:universal stress protein [Sulfurimonas sp.]|uniref:universal stress protein n=1 Tax=Sulfurimonas sp. TaxID=2022749 RepID=UPI002628ABDF|nr:universal stress protein [Sulfurimonas sp.]MCW8895570.1 universal stress protein [Sulfurimonas sp.]MCW9066805.1 universal stress protein [Sulfurimonas sp.]
MNRLKTLVAIDFSDDSLKVLQKAINFTKKFDGSVHVVHVVENSFFSPKKDLSYIREHSIKKLSEKFPDINDKNFHCVNGKIKNEIAKAAQILNSDLIIMGKSGETFFLGDTYMGSHTKDIIRNSFVPVLIVKNDHELKYKNLLLLTDFSNNSKEAIKKVVNIFPSLNIQLLNFYQVPFENRLNTYGFNDTDIAEYQFSLMQESRQKLDTFIDSLELPKDIKISGNVRKSSLNPKLFESEVEDINFDLLAVHTTGSVSFYALDILENSKKDVVILKV